MSGLRDARLQKALEAAPDAGLLPPDAVRNAVRAAAHKAVARPVAAPWWRTAWAGMAGRGGPWNAAFATLLLAGVVTLLWHDREIPGPRSDAVTPQAPAAPPPPASAPAVAPTARAPAEAEKKKDAPVAVRKPTPAQPQVAAPAAPPPAQAQGPATADAALGKAAAPAAQDMRRSEQAAPAAAAPAPAAAPPAAAMAPAPAAAAPMRSRAAPLESYVAPVPMAAVRITAQGKTIELPPGEGARLSELALRLARSAQGSDPLEAPVSASVEVPGQGVLEIAGAQVRWRNLTGRPDAAALQALATEIERLLR